MGEVSIIIDKITIDATSSSNDGVKFVSSCDNIDIKNCIIKTNTSICIDKGNGTGIANTIHIANNVLDGGSNGIVFYGSPNASVYGTGIVVDNNELKNQSASAILAYNADFTSLSKNNIQGGSAASSWTGISLTDCNGMLNANHIKLQNSATSLTGINLANFNSANTMNYGLVSNNEIRLSAGTGIVVGTGVNANIVHNSIYMTGTGITRGIQLADANNKLLVQNNNLLTSGANSYPVYIAGTTYLPQWNIDYNNMFAPTYVGYVNGNGVALPNWHSIVLSDLHSVSVQPLFSDIQNSMELLSSKDLLCPLLLSMAARDIRDTLRTSPTTMGAYHRKQPTENVAPAAVVSPSTYFNVGDPLSIQFQNKGTNTITSLTIYYSINGLPPTSFNWSGSLASGATSSAVVIEPNLLLTSTFNKIVVWTSNPNGLPDNEPFDDTIRTTTIVCGNGISGNFTVGQSGNIPDLNIAVAMLEHCGISGAVDFAIQNGTYTLPTLKQIQGISVMNTITFRSQSGNPNDVSIQGIVFDTASDIVIRNVGIQTAGGAGR